MIGSLSKAITAYAALALVDEGSLDLDGPANRQLSWLDPKLTIADLMGQTSGYSGRDGVDFDRRSASSSLAELVRRYESLEPRDPVGSSFEYSNVNYNLLGAIIERVAGRRFATHVRESVFDELGMTCSFTDLGRARAAGLSNGYRLFFRRPFPAESLPFFDSFIPSMTMASCSADLAVFFGAILARGDAARNEWFLDPGDQAVVDGYRGSYGDGFLMTRFADERTYFFQGGYRSFRSYAFLFPDKGIGVLGLMNVNTMFFIQPDLAYLMCGVAALSGVIAILRLSMLLVARASAE